MANPPRDVGASVRARLLDRARAEPTDFQGLLMRYALERLLYRLSVSPYRERFILKGALLFATWVDAPFRPTRDLDLLGYGDPDADAIAALFRTLCTIPVADDGVTFDATRLQATPIREAQEYRQGAPGRRSSRRQRPAMGGAIPGRLAGVEGIRFETVRESGGLFPGGARG